MKAREFERQVRGWFSGLGHVWKTETSRAGRYLQYQTRAMRCSGCGAVVQLRRLPHFRNFLVPSAGNGSGLFRRVIHLSKPDPKDVQADGRPIYRYFVSGGIEDPRFPRLVRSLASPCRDVQVAMAVYRTMLD